MKQAVITASVLTAITPMLNADTIFADNIGSEAVEFQLTRTIIENINTTGTVIGVGSNDVLNIRISPNTKADIIAGMKNGSAMKVIGKTNNGWYKVNYNGVEGYSSGKYIKLSSNSNISTVNKKGKVTVSSGNLNVRKASNENSLIIGKLKSGTVVDIISNEGNGWYFINSEGMKGYVSGKYITLMDGTNSSNTSSNTSTSSSNVGKIATVTASTLNIRSGAGTNYSVINKAHSGNSVKILEANSNGWYKVELTSGAIGWCSGSYLNNFREGSLVPNSSQNTTTQTQSQSQKVQAIINLAKSKLGCPYVWGAEGPNSFDCSGFTQYVFKNGANITLPRVSKDQGKVGEYVSKSNLQPGDLVFFDSSYGNNINHVGIYLGNNEMIHSPRTGDVVKITKINTNYYTNAYVTARRVVK